MFYYSILRLRPENPFHLCHSIHFLDFQSSCHGKFVFLSAQWCFSLFTLFIVIFGFFWVSSLPMSVTTHSNCCLHTNYFAERSYCFHIPPLGSLLLDFSSAVAMTPLMATDLAVTPHLYPLFLMLETHPSKFVMDRYTTVTR